MGGKDLGSKEVFQPLSGRKGGAWQQRVLLVLEGQGDEKDKSAHLVGEKEDKSTHLPASWCLSQTTDSN